MRDTVTNRRPSITDSVVSFQNSQGQEAQGTLVRLTRDNVVFEVYNPYSIVQLSEMLSHVTIRRANRDAYTGKAVVTNLINTGLMLIVSATLVDPWSDLADLGPGPELREEIESFVEDWEASNREIRPSYKVCVGNIRNFLQELSRWLEHGEMVAGITDPNAPPGVAEEFAFEVNAMVAPKLDELFDRFEEETRSISREAIPVHKAFARREIHPLMLCAPFVHRAYTKPLGYAGDYQMVNMILGKSLVGNNTYARVINALALRNDTAQAHRNRIERLTDVLISEAQRANERGEKFRALDVGCGPAAELKRFISRSWLSDRSEFEMIDFNQETLDYAEACINAEIREHRRRTIVNFIRRSVHELLKEASARQRTSQPRFHLVYCAGLFDYLSDRVCGRLLRLFYSWAFPGGLVLATNVHPRQPARGQMEYLQEWNLMLRDDDRMLFLAPELGQQRVSTDATGANVFLEVRKPVDQDTL
jgi:extracellular factor (EF) 3-hydroxypalmitic acid methyl ester biosynthesis protein